MEERRKKRTFDLRVGVGVPARADAGARAIEVHNWEGLTLVFAGGRDFRDLDAHRDEPGGFLGVERAAGRVGGDEGVATEVELVQFAVVEEADDAHPGSRDVVGILRRERDGGVQGDLGVGLLGAVGVGGDPPEGDGPVGDGVLGEEVVGAGEVGHVVVEDDHDGFDFLPVDFLRAVGDVGAPEGGIVVFGMLAEVIDAGSDVGVKGGGVVAE